MRGILVLILIFCLFSGLQAAEAIKFKSGSDSDDSSTDSGNEEDSEEVEFPDAEDTNIFDLSEVEEFGAKLFVGLPDIPEGKPIKVLTTNGVIEDGELEESGWSQVINSFVSDDNQFETESDRQAYLQENEDFKDGVPNALPIHQKQIYRLLKHAAEEVELSEDARIVVPVGTMMLENEGAVYNLPVLGAISYRKAQEGQLIYPDMDGEGFTVDKDSKLPIEINPRSDIIGWYSQEVE